MPHPDTPKMFPDRPSVFPCSDLACIASEAAVPQGTSASRVTRIRPARHVSLYFSLLAGNRAHRDWFAPDCQHNQAVCVTRSIPEYSGSGHERPAFRASFFQPEHAPYLRRALGASSAAESPAASLEAISAVRMVRVYGQCDQLDDRARRAQMNPSVRRCSCQSVGRRVSRIRRVAVRLDGWQPPRIASTISGASHARRTRRVA